MTKGGCLTIANRSLILFNSVGMATIGFFGVGGLCLYVIRWSVLVSFKNMVLFGIFSMCFGWFIRFSVIGYNFTFKSNLRRGLLKLNLGYSRHRFVVNLPSTLRVIIRGRRRLVLFALSFIDLYTLAVYIRNLRNILPYKLRGLVLENGRFNILKPGKKVKYR